MEKWRKSRWKKSWRGIEPRRFGERTPAGVRSVIHEVDSSGSTNPDPFVKGGTIKSGRIDVVLVLLMCKV